MTIPQLLRGMFTRRPRLSAVVDSVHPDPQGIRLVRELRRRHASDYLWLDVAGKPSLLVLYPEAIRHVLDASPEVYGPPELKVRGMSHFQPGAVTISVGGDWRRRRAFNDEVLGGGQPIHPSAAEVVDVAEREVARLVSCAGSTITVEWSDLHAMFGRLTVGVVFGPDAEADDLLRRLDALMRRANRLVGSHETPELREFREQVLRQVCAVGAGGLSAAACPHVEPGDPLPVAGQVPHWLFAMKDTLATNCAYALALVAAHSTAQDLARREAERASNAASVDQMAYLEGCLREAMRLWPTTPMIVRKALRDDEIDGRPVPAGSQVIVHNGFNHRDAEAFPEPDAYHPERWERGVWDYRFNAMSNGPQSCAGRELALFVGKAVLAGFLRSHRWTLARPALDPERPIPHAFRHSALSLVGAAE